MTTETMTVAFYAQHTNFAGLRLPFPEDQYGDDWRDSQDLMVLEGTEEELIAYARETLARKPWCGPFYHKVCQNLLVYLGAE